MSIQDNRKNLESIARTVRRANIAKNFALIFAECNSLEEQEIYAEKLREKCGQEGIVLIEIKLLERHPIKRLLQVVKEHLEQVFKDGLPERLGIQITGLELSVLLDEDEQAPAVLQILNMNRESYYKELPFPFIFWLPEYAIIKVANAAPDFWSIQVGSATFCTDETPRSLLPESIESGKSLTVWQDKIAQIPLLERLLDTQLSPEVGVDLLIKSADAYYYIGKTHQAQQRYEQAIEENKKAKGKPQRVAEAYNKLGLIYSDLGTNKEDLEKAVKSLRKYLEIVEQGDRTDLVAIGYNHLGLVYDKHKEYHQALQAYKKAQEISRRHGHRKLEGDVLGNMGLLFRKQKKYKDALTMHQQALTISREMDDIQGEALDLSNIGLIYHEQNQYQEAVDYYNQALLNNVRIGNKLEEMNQLIHLGDAWKALGDFSKSLEKYNSAKAIAEDININIFTVLERLAALFGPEGIEEGHQEILLLKEAIEKSRQLEKTDKELQYWERLCEIYRKRNEITERNNCLMHMGALLETQIQHLEDEEKIIGCYVKLSNIYEELDKKKKLKACKQKLEDLKHRQIIAWFDPDTVQMEEMTPVLQVGKTYKLNMQIVRTLPKLPLIYQGKIPFFKKSRRLSNIEELWVIEGRRYSIEKPAAKIPKKEGFGVSQKEIVLHKDNEGVEPIRSTGKKDYEIPLDKRGKASKVQAPLPPPFNSDSFATTVSFYFKSSEIILYQSNVEVLLKQDNTSEVGNINIIPKSKGNHRIYISVNINKFGYKKGFEIPFRVVKRKRFEDDSTIEYDSHMWELAAYFEYLTPIFILGAGNSLNAGSPDRRTIFKTILTQVYLDKKEFETMPYEELKENFQGLINSFPWDDTRKRVINLLSHLEPSIGHFHLTRLVKSKKIRVKTFITTNFDTLLEDSLMDYGLRARDFLKLVSNENIDAYEWEWVNGFPELIKIFKICGDMYFGSRLALDDESAHKWIENAVKAMENVNDFRNSHFFIILGHRFNEIDLGSIFDIKLKENLVIVYANPDEGDCQEFENKYGHICKKLRTISGTFGEFDNFIQELCRHLGMRKLI